MFARAGVSPPIRFRSSSFELVRSLVARGLGFSLQMVRPVGDLSYEGLPLVARPLSEEMPGEAVVLAWREGRMPTRATQAVISLAAALWSGQSGVERLDRLVV